MKANVCNCPACQSMLFFKEEQLDVGAVVMCSECAAVSVMTKEDPVTVRRMTIAEFTGLEPELQQKIMQARRETEW